MREAAVHLRWDERQEQLEHGQRAVRVEVESLHNRMQQNSDQLHRLTATLQEMQLKLMRQIQQETNEVWCMVCGKLDKENVSVLNKENV